MTVDWAGHSVTLMLGATVLSLVASWWLTGLFRRHAIAKAILDLPSERSSHTAPTPRGGGASIVVVVLLGTAALGLGGLLPFRISLALFCGGGLVGAIGWIDDRRGVAPLVRATVHACAALCVVLAVGGFHVINGGRRPIDPGPLESVIAVLAIVWTTNLYNFMDGIDGLASVEAITVGTSAALLLLLSGASGLATVSIVVASASAGFLFWNWTPARIFMGDAGSGFLGFIFGSLAVISEGAGTVRWYLWLLLLLVFAADASLTLLRRVAHGETWYAAHRLHAYQRLVQSGFSHRQVVLATGLLNVMLGAFAVAAFESPRLLGPVLGVSAVVVIGAYLAAEHRMGMWHAATQTPVDRRS